MGVLFSSCCHRRAQLAFGDKLYNLALGLLVPLRWLSEVGISTEERRKRLKVCRSKLVSLTKSSYDSSIKGKWVAAEQTVPRPDSLGGGVVQIIVYTPVGRPNEAAPAHLVLWAHGGGCVMGDVDDLEGVTFMNTLSRHIPEVSCCWASIGYRLAPENKFPTMVDDVVCVYEAMKNPTLAEAFGYDTSKIALAGVSAGGFVVGHAAHTLATKGSRPNFVACFYPMVSPALKFASCDLYGDLSAAPRSFVGWCWHALLEDSTEGKEAEGAVFSSPLAQSADLLMKKWDIARGLRFLIKVGTYDMLHDEGVALAKVLASEGVAVETVEAVGSHVLANKYDPKAEQAMIAWFRRALLD